MNSPTGVDPLSRPKLRGLEVVNATAHGEPILQVYNRERLCDLCLQLPQAFGLILRYFDGAHTVADVVHAVHADTGVRVQAGMVEGLIVELDQVLVLDTPAYEAARQAALERYRETGVREPACAGGAYHADADKLRGQLARLFTGPGGPGLPDDGRRGDDLRAVFAPHIDFGRGGVSYGHAFRELAERSQADTFVIVATSHYSPERFTLTRNDFATPLGVARTDRDYVDALAKLYGEVDAYRDELAHRPEHSIEFEVLMLQFLFAGRREFAIVPLLVGPFQDAVEDDTEPRGYDDVARMIAALQTVERDFGKRVCYVISGDLAHIGPKFGDPWTIDRTHAARNREADAGLLQALETARPGRLFDAIANERDERRICGFPPAYVTLAAAEPSAGQTHHRDQYVDPKGNEIVSFAALSFAR